MNGLFSFLKAFYCATLPFYLSVFVLLTVVVFPIQVTAGYHCRKLLRPHESLLVILLTTAAIQFYFALKSYSVFLKPFPLQGIEGPFWKACILPAISLLRKAPSLVKGLDALYIFGWGVSCGVSVLILFARREEAAVFYSSLILCYVLTALLHLTFHVVSPFYFFKASFLQFKEGMVFSFPLHEASEKATRLLQSGVSLKEVMAKAGYPFQPISAFPSFHISYAYLLKATLEEFHGRGLLGSVFLAAMIFSAVALGFHWLVDLAGGFLVGVFSFRMGKCLHQAFLKMKIFVCCLNRAPRS